MSDLVLHNTLASLASTIHTFYAGGTGRGSPKKITLVVPGPTSGAFPTKLRAALANLSTNGIVGNLELISFGSLERSLLGEGEGVIDKEVLIQRMVEIFLHEPTMFKESFTKVAAYVGWDKEYSIHERANRAYQLAEELAGIFHRYMMFRPELVKAFDSGSFTTGAFSLQATDTDPATVIEELGWQEALWKEVFNSGSSEITFPPSETRFLRLREFFTSDRMEQLTGPMGFIWDSTVALPFLKVPRYLMSLREDVKLWGLDHGKEEHLAKHDANPLLDMGVLQERHTQLSDDKFTITPTEESGACAQGLLGVAQLLSRGITPTEKQVEDAASNSSDPSLRVVNCPGVRREMEVVADAIWRRILQDKSYKFSDIAVVFCDALKQDQYMVQLRSTFKDLYDIPLNLSGARHDSRSRVLDATQRLMDLPKSNFEADVMANLLSHPALAGWRWGDQQEQWVKWLAELGIYHGADHDDHRDTYINKDLFNWEQGLLRLSLGEFVAGLPSGEEHLLSLTTEAQEYIPYESGGDPAPFVSLASSLLSDARFIRSSLLTMREWSTLLGHYLTSYIVPRAMDDRRILGSTLRAVRKLAQFEGTSQFPFEVPAGYINTHLRRFAGSGFFALKGVTVATSLSELRHIPYKAVYLCGMGEGGFPRRDKVSSIDLMGFTKRYGDPDPYSQDRLDFVSRLSSTTERLTLSYVGRDRCTGEKLELSSVVKDLRRALVNAKAVDIIKAQQKIPLERFAYDDQEDEPLLMASRLEHAYAHLRDDIHKINPELTQQDLRHLSLEMQKLMKLDPLPETALQEENRSISLFILRKFLENPVQGFARYALNMHSEDDGEEEITGIEPFETSTFQPYKILLPAFINAMNDSDDKETLLTKGQQEIERHLKMLELKGEVPHRALLGKIQHDWDWFIEEWHDQFANWYKGVFKRPVNLKNISLKIVRLGKETTHSPTEIVLNPLCITTPGGKYELSGTTALMVIEDGQDENGEPIEAVRCFLNMTLSANAAVRHYVSAYLSMCALSVSEFEHRLGNTIPVVVLTKGSATPKSFTIKSHTDAHNFFANLINTLHTQNATWFLPLVKVKEYWTKAINKGHDEEDLRSRCEDAFTGTKRGLVTYFQPLNDPECLSVPDAPLEIVKIFFKPKTKTPATSLMITAAKRGAK